MIRLFLSIVLLSVLNFSAAHADELKTVDYVDLSRYAGTWYQIARKPVFFETGCVCSVQKLTPTDSGAIAVLNTCNLFSVNGKVASINGTATVVDSITNAKLKVDFGLPSKGDYWIIGLAADYSWAIVTDPGNTTLYVLSKTPELSEEQYQLAVQTAAKQRDTSVLQKTLQVGCSY